MSNISNYIQATETIQSFSQQPHFYKITNQIDGKYYYGVHNGSNTKNYDGSGLLLHRAYEKHGKENFIKEILKEFDTEAEAYEYEAVIVNENMINKNNPMCYNICTGGKGGDTFSCQTSERQEEISQKLSDAAIKQWEDMSHEDRAEMSQNMSDSAIKRYENMTPEQWEEFSHKVAGKNNGMFGKSWVDGKSEEEVAVIGKKISVANSGEKHGAHTQYQHPYNPNIIGNCTSISCDIKKNWPNKPLWNQIPRRKRNELKIKK